ncbi:MAG: DUF3754 domain-containing protein [Gammaproteobacteria bacterium]|nr:DUF3754 domain-containing protein [Gammaproteobacteria bacterium]MBT4493092.1 DUF3754 domain-containing protein [Gammaproteobacteria bacterium]MBT7369226.1 DUF3754 domain-containing protein [Gammaproteobacteria bacterium]
MCIATDHLSAADQLKFREFCHLLQSVFHFEYHHTLERLKDLYAPNNPDRDTRVIESDIEEDGDFTETLRELLNKANYEMLDREAIEAAFNESSLFKLKLDIDFDDFEEALLFIRGESEHTEQVRTLFGLVRKEISFSNFDRVVIYIRLKKDVTSELAQGKPGATMLKLFQNVPRADVEMLFPNTKVAMRALDKLMIGVPALIGAGAIVTTNVGTSLLLLGTLLGFWFGLHTEQVELDEARLVAILAGLGGLGSYVWKQFSNFRNRKLLFMQSLTQNLYFKNLDNNAGVFHRLIDDAEEEECKEAILAYYFLLKSSDGLMVDELDEAIETWLSSRWDAELDFEVDDGLEKLKRLGLATELDGRFAAVGLDEACLTLDSRWDNYFEHRVTEVE